MISAFLRAHQKNLHFNKLPFDSNVPSGLKATLPGLFFPKSVEGRSHLEFLLKTQIPCHSVALEWGLGNWSFNKCLCGTKDQAGAGDTVFENECVLWARGTSSCRSATYSLCDFGVS